MRKSTNKGIFPQKAPFVLDLAKMTARMSDFGLRVAAFSEIDPLLELGERLIGDKLATSEAVARVHQITGVTAWVTGHPIDGLFLIVPLSIDGETAVRSGDFAPSDVVREHLSGPNELCGGVYVGIYAGATKRARRNVMMASATLRLELFGSVPCFARAATKDGARSMTGLGFKPAGYGADKLFVQEALVLPSEAA